MDSSRHHAWLRDDVFCTRRFDEADNIGKAFRLHIIAVVQVCENLI
jgi:hypothetical protein